MKTKVAIVDDHVLLRNGLSMLLKELDYEVIFECSNGQELQKTISGDNLPDIVLMDINMPEMDGYEATAWLKQAFPLVHVLTLSMYDAEEAIIKMLRSGSGGFVIKEAEPAELKRAIDDVISKGVHYSEQVTGKLLHSIWQQNNIPQQPTDYLSKNEIQFLKLASTEMTYKEIAHTMHLSPRTIDGYRDALFEKLNLKSRVGLVLFAIKHGVVNIGRDLE